MNTNTDSKVKIYVPIKSPVKPVGQVRSGDTVGYPIPNPKKENP